MSEPRVTVIIPTHNRLMFLPETLASVRAQTYPHWDAIVVDDASTDGTESYLQHLPERFRILRLPEHRERAAAKNAALRLATGDYVAFLDSDDRWLPTKLADDMRLLAARPALGWVYGPSTTINAAGRAIRHQPLRLPEGDILRTLWTSYFIPNSSVTVRRSLLAHVGGFTEDRALAGSEDWELWMRVAAGAPSGCVRRRNVEMRVHGQNTMGDAAHMERSMLRALHTTLANDALMARLGPWRAAGESAMYLHIAMTYARQGRAEATRQWLRRARAAAPAVIWRGAFLKTWLRSLLTVKTSIASATATP